MKIAVELTQSHLLQGIVFALWGLFCWILLAWAAGSLEEFEPRAAGILFGMAGLWCVPALIYVKRCRKRGGDGT